MHTLVFLLGSALGPCGGLVFMSELNSQASGPGPRVFSAVAVVLLAGLLAV